MTRFAHFMIFCPLSPLEYEDDPRENMYSPTRRISRICSNQFANIKPPIFCPLSTQQPSIHQPVKQDHKSTNPNQMNHPTRENRLPLAEKMENTPDGLTSPISLSSTVTNQTTTTLCAATPLVSGTREQDVNKWDKAHTIPIARNGHPSYRPVERSRTIGRVIRIGTTRNIEKNEVSSQQSQRSHAGSDVSSLSDSESGAG